MWTVRCGSHDPTLTNAPVAMSPEWSSSITIALLVASAAAKAFIRRCVVVTPVGLCARGCRKTATGLLAQRLDELVDDRSLVVEVDADHVGAELVEQVEQRRERRVLDDHSITEAHDDLGDTVERVHRPVDDGQRLGRERPAVAQPSLEIWQHRIVEVARRQRLPADPGDDRPEVGQQRRRWRAGGEVEREVAGALGHSPVPSGRAGPGRLAHERALPAAGVDGSDRRQRLPRLADGRRRDAERLGQFAHRRKTGADGQVAAGDHPPDRCGDAASAAVVDRFR